MLCKSSIPIPDVVIFHIIRTEIGNIYSPEHMQ